MILKDKDRVEQGSGRQAAGDRHEKDVAFYLQRAFGRSEEVFVINDLCVDYEGQPAQIDHLIIYTYGFVIVESKSIYGEVKVNDDGEWSRSYQGRWQGIPSPIKQAQLQQDVLKSLLCDHAGAILGRILGLQKNFGGREWFVLCAVSSSSILHREEMPNDISPLIVKAEFVPDRITSMIERKHTGVAAFFLESRAQPRFTKPEVNAICKFLLNRHQNNRGEVEAPSRARVEKGDGKRVAEPSVRHQSRTATGCAESESGCESVRLKCKKCGEAQALSAQHGRYGYFLRCQACEANTPMKRPCGECGSKITKVSKSGAVYTLRCSDCGCERTIYTENGHESEPFSNQEEVKDE